MRWPPEKPHNNTMFQSPQETGSKSAKSNGKIECPASDITGRAVKDNLAQKLSVTDKSLI